MRSCWWASGGMLPSGRGVALNIKLGERKSIVGSEGGSLPMYEKKDVAAKKSGWQLQRAINETAGTETSHD